MSFVSIISALFMNQFIINCVERGCYYMTSIVDFEVCGSADTRTHEVAASGVPTSWCPLREDSHTIAPPTCCSNYCIHDEQFCRQGIVFCFLLYLIMFIQTTVHYCFIDIGIGGRVFSEVRCFNFLVVSDGFLMPFSSIIRLLTLSLGFFGFDTLETNL